MSTDEIVAKSLDGSDEVYDLECWDKYVADALPGLRGERVVVHEYTRSYLQDQDGVGGTVTYCQGCGHVIAPDH